MELRPDFKTGPWFEWSTDLPDDERPRLSPIFKFRDRALFFFFQKISLRCGESFYALSIKPSSLLARDPQFTVEVRAKTAGGFLFSYFSALDHRLDSGENIWCLREDVMRTHVTPDVHRAYDVRFHVFFGTSVDSAVRIVYPGTEHAAVQTPAQWDASSEIRLLSNDLLKLLGGESAADVQLTCDGRTFPAHRSLLSARSGVFGAMLASDMVEGRTGRVQIEDAEAGVFQHFLDYLYCGMLEEELSEDAALKLYQLADRYAVRGLRRRCSRFLADNLSRDNCCAVLGLADRHSDARLKEAAVSYVLAQRVPQDESWFQLCRSRPELANEVLNRFAASHASCDEYKTRLELEDTNLPAWTAESTLKLFPAAVKFTWKKQTNKGQESSQEDLTIEQEDLTIEQPGLSMETLSADFVFLLDNEPEPDVRFFCKDGVVPACRAILSSRSRVFTDIFESNMEFRRSGVVDVQQDMDLQTARLLLQFLYTGEIPDFPLEMAPVLYGLGEKYDVPALKKMSSDLMSRNVSRGNFTEFLHLADLHADEAFKRAVIARIVESPELMNTVCFG